MDGPNNTSEAEDRRSTARRRDILKATSTVATSATIAGTAVGIEGKENTTNTNNVDIKIFETYDLSQPSDSWMPRDWSHAETLKQVVQRTFNPSNVSPNVKVIKEPLSSQIDETDDVKRAIENAGIELAEGSNILLTSGHTGGRAAFNYSYAGAEAIGHEMGNFNGENDPLKEPINGSYENFHYIFLRTALHEIAHNLLDLGLWDGCRYGNCSSDHSVGESYWENGVVYRSPLMVGTSNNDCYAEGKNYCCEEIVDPANNPTRRDLNYGNCFWEQL